MAFSKLGSEADPGPSAQCGAKSGSQPFMQSYLVVFIGYLTMYLIRKNLTSRRTTPSRPTGLSADAAGMICFWASPITLAWVKRWFFTTPTAKHQTIPAVHA